ncbi:PorV/PorQ family protein [candidate division KSB1 bacterium]|nr:MAG: PorV/PorQ family protein [candidate division KSB1 bacterium]
MRAARVYCIAVMWITAFGMSSVAHGEWVIGRYAGEFLSLGAGARALAMGDASVAAPTPSSAAYYNPAALAGIEKRYVEFMHASQFDNLFAYDYLSLAGKLRGGQCAAVTVLYTRVSDIPLTRLADPNRPLSDDNRVVVKSETGDHELALMAAAARPLGASWKAGVTAKLLYKTVAGESAYGLGFDAGVKRTVLKNVQVGAALRDVTTSVLAWSTGRTEAILPSLAVGGAWSAELRSLNARLSLAADLDGHFESRGEAETVEAGLLTVEPHVGLEYLISNTVALRGGINGTDLTAGAGLNFSWLSVHAAFQDHADLGLTHRISVAVAW